ncbi:MAG: LptF/LptG family permease [Opitutales bacterium]|nr:LptF/LptG family permease [Opitutales bacterium]
MKLIDRHVLFQCLQTIALALFAFIGLLLLQNIYADLEDLVKFGASPLQILTYFAIQLPSFLPSILPLVFMISILFSLGQLHRNSEIVAMRACGLGVWRITRSIWLLGVILTATLFALNSKIVPWSVEQSRTIWDNFRYSNELKSKSADEIGIVKALAYNNFSDGRLWFINRFSEYNFRAFGITVSELDESRKEKTRIMASEGYFDEVAGSWVMLNGRVLTFDPQTREPVSSIPFGKRVFEDLKDSPTMMQLREKKVQDLSFFELRKVLQSMPPEGDPDRAAFLVRYYSMGASPLICLVIVGIAVPFAISGVRVNPMVGVSKAMGLFFGYFILAHLSTTLGSMGHLSPLMAAALPPCLAALLAVWLARSMRFA